MHMARGFDQKDLHILKQRKKLWYHMWFIWVTQKSKNEQPAFSQISKSFKFFVFFFQNLKSPFYRIVAILTTTQKTSKKQNARNFFVYLWFKKW